MFAPSHLGVLLARASAPTPPKPRYVDATPRSATVAPPTVAIRLAGGRDDAAVLRLEQMEEREIAPGARLVAEVDGRVVAALAVADDSAVADPFEHTAPMVELLRLRARQLRVASVPRPAPLRHAVRLGVVR